jgi:hypothetical protein
MGRTAWGLSTIFAAVVLGCGGSDGAAQGHERGACYPNSTCEAGLACLSNFCVRVDVDGASGASGSAGAGGSNDGGLNPGTAGGGLSGGGASGTGGAGGKFNPAPHAPLPQVANLGGAVLSAPKLRPIFFTDDPDQADVMSFLSELAAGSYWTATTSEYGVGALTLLAPVVGAMASAPTISDGTLQAALATNTLSPSALWGPADPSTVFLFVLPPSVALTYGQTTCCVDYGGYHDETLVNGVAVPYVVACACPDFFGPDWNRIDERTVVLSHELIEAATDPFPRSNPAFYAANQANLVWTMLTGGELGDMCVIQPDMATVLPSGRYAVQKSWSNAAAALGNDPCVPAASSPPYFNSMPVLDVIPYGSSGYRTNGVQIPIGTSRTIDLQLFSAGAVPNGWNVSAYAYEDLYGGTPSLTFALDRSTGRNADVLRLTITPVQSNPALGGNPFVILSTVGSPGASNYRSHVAMGFVTTD